MFSSFLFGSCMFCNTESSVDLCFFPVLRDVDVVSSYNWGGDALVHLYGCLDKVC